MTVVTSQACISELNIINPRTLHVVRLAAPSTVGCAVSMIMQSGDTRSSRVGMLSGGESNSSV